MSHLYCVTYYGRHNVRLKSEDVTADDFTHALMQLPGAPSGTVRLWVGMVPPPQPRPGICGICGRPARKCDCLPFDLPTLEAQHG